MADGSVAVAELIARWRAAVAVYQGAASALLAFAPKAETGADNAVEGTERLAALSKTTGPLYEAGSALCEALARVEAARQQEQRRREAVERMMPLCSDHRDKQREEPCLACQRDEARRLAEQVRGYDTELPGFPWEAS